MLGETCVHVCTLLQDWPAAVLCMSISVLQMVVLDFYLLNHLGSAHYPWLGLDVATVALLGFSILQARHAIRVRDEYPQQQEQPHPHNNKNSSSGEVVTLHGGKYAWMAWLLMSTSVAAKTVFIFNQIVTRLDEKHPSFWGPNTLKTTVALGSCTFITLLITQHDAPADSEGRRYIEAMTGTVALDLLDTVDILEILFDEALRHALWLGLEEAMLVVAVFNLLLPAVPLYTLASSNFGALKPSARLVYGHRMLLVLAVNVPNLLVRMVLWHGIKAGISPFTLKNLIAILFTFYEIYDHRDEIYEDLVIDTASERKAAAERSGSQHEKNGLMDTTTRTDHDRIQIDTDPDPSQFARASDSVDERSREAITPESRSSCNPLDPPTEGRHEERRGRQLRHTQSSVDETQKQKPVRDIV